MKIQTVIFLCMGIFCVGVQAELGGSDNFNDNVRDTSKWAVVVPRLSEINGRLEFTSSGIGEEQGIWAWIANSGDMTRNWSVTLDVSSTATPSVSGQFCAMGLFVVNSADDTDSFGVLLATDADAGHLAGSLWEINGTESESWDPTTENSAALRISYDASTGELSSEYDTGSGYTTITSFDTGNWYMGTGDSFDVAIAGISGSFAVAPGQVYADNFGADTPSGIANHLDFFVIELLHNFGNPHDSHDDGYEFLADAETDDTVTGVVLTTPGSESISLTNYYDEYGYRGWEYYVSSPTTLAGRFADGNYTVKLTHEDLSIESTSIPFTEKDGSTPLAAPTMMPTFSMPSPLQNEYFVDSIPLTFEWPDIDTNATAVDIWRSADDYWSELGWFSDEITPSDGPLATRSIGPVAFTQAAWKVELWFGNAVLNTNDDAVLYAVVKSTESDYQFTVLAASADHDGDGQSNEQEHIAGMDPTDSNSVFRITNWSPVGSDFMIEWPSVSGRVYRTLWTDHLANGFQTLESNILYPRNSSTDTVHGAAGKGFYQVEVEMQ